MADEATRKVFYGVFLIIIAVIFLLAGLGAFTFRQGIFGYPLDIVAAFVLTIVGLFYILNETKKK